jgi:hypothetical protein
MLQSWNISLYTADCASISIFCCFWVSSVPMVLVVQKAVFMLECLNMLVKKDVSLPMYEKTAHF